MIKRLLLFICFIILLSTVDSNARMTSLFYGGQPETVGCANDASGNYGDTWEDGIATTAVQFQILLNYIDMGTDEHNSGDIYAYIRDSNLGSPCNAKFVIYDDDGTGTHDGAGDAVTLSDSTATWIVDDLIGRTVYNTTDGSECTITDNDATTVTCSLSGGTDDDWDAADVWDLSSGGNPGTLLFTSASFLIDSDTLAWFTKSISGVCFSGILWGGWTIDAGLFDDGHRNKTTSSGGRRWITDGDFTPPATWDNANDASNTNNESIYLDF